jgi:tRNA pseudouridine32 synthase/23S rRNA pseudouridine746 synthase
MHQIRVHLMHLGCPILGDALYGEGRSGAARLMLHARALSFDHPAGGRVKFEAPLPADFVGGLTATRLYPPPTDQ